MRATFGSSGVPHPAKALLGVGLAAALMASACSGSSGTTTARDTARSVTPTSPSSSDPPASRRVDLTEPTFSDPTTITNPLFPKVVGSQVIQLGAEGDQQLRFEVTTLPDTKTIEWNGQQIETRVDHFMAYGDGRILEVAVDFYAQADDGAVWYFGEDVYNYKQGVVHDNEGTWLAGKDGPPGMIMPGDPSVGDIYRPENIPDLVFEEVTVQGVDEPLDGPQGPISGLLIQERLMDGTLEDKVFAPGYGEFRAQVKTLDELYNLAVAVPRDSQQARMPRELSVLWRNASDLVGREGSSPRQVSSTLDTMTRSWASYRSGDVPPLLETQMSDALQALDAAVGRARPAGPQQAAIDAAQAALDLQLPYRTLSDVDVERLALWAHQLDLDAATGYLAGVAGDTATLQAIWDRIDHSMAGPKAKAVTTQLRELQAAVDAGDLTGAADVTAALQNNLATLG